MVKRVVNPAKAFITHTFCDCAENHVGMKSIGKMREKGLDYDALKAAAKRCGGRFVELECRGEKAGVAVFPGGVDKLLGNGGAEKLLAESAAQEFDITFLNTRRKIVQNKHGRSNNIYGDVSQQPDIPSGKGTVVAFGDAPLMKELRSKLPEMVPDGADLVAETNYYEDVTKAVVGIGFHGDTERRVVIGIRLGAASQPLRFQWYNRSKAISDETSITLNHGDIYAMSAKAVGFDWNCPSKVTLRHGCGRKAKRRAAGN